MFGPSTNRVAYCGNRRTDLASDVRRDSCFLICNRFNRTLVQMAMSPLTQEQVPTPPTPPTPPTGPVIRIGGQDGVQIFNLPTRPMTARDVSALRARRSEISNQLESATSRRNSLAGRLENAEGVSKAGLEQRIGQLDQRILGLEKDLDETGQQLASVPAGLASSSIASAVSPFGLNPGQITGISIVGTIFIGFPLAIAIARNIFRRGSRQAPAPVAQESTQRMERLEQAVDAIAIEIERISEGQRFVTKLLTEGSAPALSVGQRSAEPVRLPDRESMRASRETA